MSRGILSRSPLAVPAAPYTGPKVTTGPRSERPAADSVPEASVHFWMSGTALGTLVWQCVSDGSGGFFWGLISVEFFSGTYADLADLGPESGEQILPGLMVTDGDAKSWKYDAGVWNYLAPAHGPWTTVESGTSFNLPLAGTEGLQDGDMGISDTEGTAIYWRYSASANEWFRVGVLPTTGTLPQDTVTAAWFDADHLPVVGGLPVGDQGWDDYSGGTVASVSGKVELSTTSSFDLKAHKGLPRERMALIIRDLSATFGSNCEVRAGVWTPVVDELVTWHANQAWGNTWYFGGSTNTNTTAQYGTDTTLEIYYDHVAGKVTVYFDRSATPAYEWTLSAGTTTGDYLMGLAIAGVTAGTTKIICSKFAAIGWT